MIVLLILAVLGIGWLLSAWSFMLFVGMVHHEILPAVIPVSYTTSLKFSLLFLAFALVGGVLGGSLNQK
jgi:hypothetical protein